MRRAFPLAAAGCLAASGFIHAQLYVDGYRVVPRIGPSFLVQASGSFAVAVLLVVAAWSRDRLPALALRLAAAALAAGALAGFVASRTVGVLGFVERGLQPAPQALLSVLVEVGVLVLLGAEELVRRRAAARPVDVPAPARA